VDKVQHVEAGAADLLSGGADELLERGVDILENAPGNDVNAVGGIPDQSAEDLFFPFPEQLGRHELAPL